MSIIVENELLGMLRGRFDAKIDYSQKFIKASIKVGEKIQIQGVVMRLSTITIAFGDTLSNNLFYQVECKEEDFTKDSVWNLRFALEERVLEIEE